ncbi:hypothetical protein [Actinomadura latina]|uniref:WD40 repeat domain-containing protein n=1 Tax=Actinomadura latina TaxID=163603 RepID=A0A846Z577_9ACTN|nr:hypothetical protein [Actinomadura latina]NKZ05543.1 hypothetical protein [Actinomadura latina]
MKPETIVKSTLDEWAAEARVPVGLADRALRGRTRRRSLKFTLIGGTSALLAGATAVALFSAGGPVRSEPSEVAFKPASLSSDTSLRTDLGSDFPRRLVAAGHMAVAAYYTSDTPMGAIKGTFRRTWYLYNPSTGMYEQTNWTYLSVAPGMQRAAVLQGPLPTSRVGVLDMRTRKVTRWIKVDKPVGGVAWSPDARRLLLTSYAANPDTLGGDPRKSPRTGYYVVNSAAEPGAFHALPGMRDNPNNRQDLGWSRDGKLIWAPTATVPTKVFYAPDGRRQSAPAHEAETEDAEAGLSPNGTLLPAFGPRPGPAVTVTNVDSGRKVAVLPIEQALAWADDSRLFAIGCDVEKCTGKGEFRNRLLLVTLKGKITPLTGYQHSDRAGSWTPVFTHR